MAGTATLGRFAQLLEAAHRQGEPQRLLFVFAQRQAGEYATAAQREAFERGEGGYLRPCLCVDKAPEEIDDFASLAAESDVTGVRWDVVFVASLAGRAGVAPNRDEADQPLRFMVHAINEGRVEQFAAFDRDGNALRFV